MIVVVEVTAQAGSFLDIAFASSYAVVLQNDVAIQSLMVLLFVIVLHILSDSEAKMLFTKGNDLVQTFGLVDRTKRSAKAFRFGLLRM